MSKQSTSSIVAEMQAHEKLDSQESRNDLIDFNDKRASLQVKHKQRDLVFV